MSARHNSHDESAFSDEDLDSAATTLFGNSAYSSKGHSIDEPRRYADIELETFDASTSRRRNAPKLSDDSDRKNSFGKSDDDDEEDGDSESGGEDWGLLAHDTAILNESARNADVLPDESEPPPPPAAPSSGKQPVTWSSLPRKGQLAILTISRLSEPLAQTSLQSYMFYQLKSFKSADGSVPSDSTVAKQAGLLAAAFTGAQLLTALMWGRLADWQGMGRKRVILVGLFGTAIGILGFGFSESFAVAVFWRAVGGMLNGNVGVMRTMISEIIREKKFQSRAFLLLPMTFNIGVIIGPLLGGILADPAGSYPGVFGPGGLLGGNDGVWLFMRWPYALPNMVSAAFVLLSAFVAIFGLEETLEGLRDRPDHGLRFARWVRRTVTRRKPGVNYSALIDQDKARHVGIEAGRKEVKAAIRKKLPFRRIWTRNVMFVLFSHGLLAMHVGTFTNLWFIFLSTPRYNPSGKNTNTGLLNLPAGYQPHGPFTFTGGLGLPPPSIGTALAILGVIGIGLQLLLYPWLSFKLGTITSFRGSLALFPITYCLAPFLAIVPSTMPPPTEASGILVWIAITAVLVIQVLARTFALPATAILVNNSSPHPSVLGTVHGIAQSVSAAARTVGPMVGSWIYAVGLNKGMVGTAWWTMAGVAVVGAIAGRWVKEGDGHEIWLEGEEEDD